MEVLMLGPTAVHGVHTDEQFEARQQAVAGAHGAQVREAATTIEAYVNHGRWLADCVCFSGVSVSVEWGTARCFECGRVYRVDSGTLWLPHSRQLQAVERVLAERKDVRTRNWKRGETVATLRAEAEGGQ